jgi:hypothetical protein
MRLPFLYVVALTSPRPLNMNRIRLAPGPALPSHRCVQARRLSGSGLGKNPKTQQRSMLELYSNLLADAIVWRPGSDATRGLVEGGLKVRFEPAQSGAERSPQGQTLDEPY